MQPSPSSPPGVSCVIPVFNEAGAVAETLRSVAEVLGESGLPWEIIMVDDGSTDGSGEAARASGQPVRVIQHDRNRGYGAAIKTGSRSAEHDWVLILDADGTYPAAEIRPLLRTLAEDPEAEMIVGQRNQTRATDGPFRLMGKRILVGLANFLSGHQIPDLNSGLRLMRRRSLSRYASLLPDGFSLTTSITLALLCSGAHVRYVPIEYRARKGESKIRPVRDMYNFSVLIMRTITYFNPLKVYVPLSVLLIAISVLTVVLSKLIGGEVMDVTALFLFMGGLQVLLIGVIADLVIKVAGLRD